MSRPAPPQATIVVLLSVLTLIARAQTLGNPFLGFDEQFYLLVGDRMLRGALPYVDIFDRKPIGLFLVFSGIRRLGGQGILEYQLVAAAFAAATAIGIYALARRLAPWPGALAAAAAYPLWLNLTECEGGQSPVFYALPMIAAAVLTVRALDGNRLVAHGTAAMLLTGIAIQIKYTALFEGLWFGLALLWAAHRTRTRPLRIAALGVWWIGCALLPTVIALAYYAQLGHLDTFIFSNFRSLAGRLPDPLPRRIAGLAAIVGVLAPLLAFARPDRANASVIHLFVTGWLVAALLSILGFGAYLSVSYAAPALIPAAIVAAPALDRHRRATIAVLLVALIAGQMLVSANIASKGTRAQALALAAAAQPKPGQSLYVYNGPPALYLLTGSPLPTRWPFPGHLNTADEATAAAIGTDPVAEVRRILAGKPEAIVDTIPAYALGNAQTHAIVTAALARDYRLVLRQPLARGRTRLVYRLIGLRAPTGGAIIARPSISEAP